MLLRRQYRQIPPARRNGLGAKQSEDNMPSTTLALGCGSLRSSSSINDVIDAFRLRAEYKVGVGPQCRLQRRWLQYLPVTTICQLPFDTAKWRGSDSDGCVQ